MVKPLLLSASIVAALLCLSFSLVASPSYLLLVSVALVFAAIHFLTGALFLRRTHSRAGVYAEASAIVYTLGQSRGVTAIAKIAGGLVLLRM